MTNPTLHMKGTQGMTIREVVGPKNNDLQLLNYVVADVEPGYTCAPLTFPGKEVLLTCVSGQGKLMVENKTYKISQFDMMYIPVGSAFQLSGEGDELFSLGIALAPSEVDAVPVHVAFAKVRNNKKYLRKMPGKKVYVTFGEEFKAQYLVAGLVFFNPNLRSFPAHMHTDQEEVYHFLDGYGAMEIYPSEEKKTFVHNVKKGDIATIPLEHYHPVFSQDEPLAWAWIIAGERYWVGDRDKQWMSQAEQAK